MMIIYKITNLINGKIYIGKASGKRVSNRYLGSGKLVKRAVTKYGRENFRHAVIDFAESKLDQNRKEVFWIDFYDARNQGVGYNILPGGEGGSLPGECNHNYGKPKSEQHRKKLSKAVSGANNACYGTHRSEETKRRLAIAAMGNKSHLGMTFSEESRQKMSLARKEYLKDNPVHYTEEHRKNMSESIKLMWDRRRRSQC